MSNQEAERLSQLEEMTQEIEAKNRDLEHALERLHKAQQQIVAEEKLSSLGQLAAGVAHEIKNPLNFIKNFNEVSLELIEEIGEVVTDSSTIEKGVAEDINEILGDLRTNLGKVGEHSHRADGIVRSMLEHSRGKTDEWRETDLNAMLKQYRDLAYHATRAENTEFNITNVEDLDDNIPPLIVVPQDISRAFLNMLTNSCQAIEEKARGCTDDFDPQLTIGSRRTDEGYEFWVRDNGTGIPDDILQHMFEPFVTTKGTGQGTGLGLSLTMDIVQRHKGHINVESEVGEYTSITIQLPFDPANKDSDDGNNDDQTAA